MPDANSETVVPNGQEPVVERMTDRETSSAPQSSPAPSVQNSWITPFGGAQVRNSQSTETPGHVIQPFATSRRSIGSDWKAGPGGKAGAEQVTSSHGAQITRSTIEVHQYYIPILPLTLGAVKTCPS